MPSHPRQTLMFPCQSNSNMFYVHPHQPFQQYPTRSSIVVTYPDQRMYEMSRPSPSQYSQYGYNYSNYILGNQNYVNNVNVHYHGNNVTKAVTSQINLNNMNLLADNKNLTRALTGAEVLRNSNVITAGVQRMSLENKPNDQINKTVEDKSKRNRTVFSDDQKRALKEEYNQNKFLDQERRQNIAKNLRLPEKTVKIWFQNRRMQEKHYFKVQEVHGDVDTEISSCSV